MSDNIVPPVAAAAVLETAAATPSALHFNLEAAPFIFFTQEDYLALKAENERLKAENVALRTASYMLAESANAGLNAYKALDECGDNFEADEVKACSYYIDLANGAIAKVLAGEILESLPAVDEEDEAAAEAEADAKERAQAQAAVGDSWGDETQEKPETPRSEPLPAAPVAAASRPVRVMKAASAPLPAAPRNSGVKSTVRKNQSSLFERVTRDKEGLPIWYLNVTESLGNNCNKFCKEGSSCTRSNCGFNHICKNYGLKGDAIVLTCTKFATECSHVHHQCPFGKGCKRTDCKAAH